MSDEFLRSMELLVKDAEETADIAARLGAQVVALTVCVDAMRGELLSMQCLEASRQFRAAIEDVMAILDDRLLPREFHAELLDKTNDLISLLAHVR